MSTLDNEGKLKNEVIEGMPHIYWYGSVGDYNAMVMDLLGASLESLFNTCQRKFSLKTVLMATEQMVTLLESIR